MPKTKIKNPKQANYVVLRMQRWLIAQRLGKVFFDSILTDEQIEAYRDYFLRSDVLSKDIPIINIQRHGKAK